jgi:hypothetical protein
VKNLGSIILCGEGGIVFSSEDLRKRKDGESHDIVKKEYGLYLGSVEGSSRSICLKGGTQRVWGV